MQTRREVLKSIAVASVVCPITSEAKQQAGHEPIRIEASALADLMQKTCGGQWRVSVDKDLEFVLVQKVLA